jgi:hypothetical protein
MFQYAHPSRVEKGHIMSNLGTNIMKVSLLVGGAIVGAWLSRLFDEALLKRAEEQSERDRDRYAQGLTPVEPKAKEQG